MKRTVAAVLLTCVISLGASLARADMVPPDVEPCMGKQVGDACVYNGATGTCQNGTCSKLDYAHWDHDASSIPPSASYSCVKCVPGSNTSSNTNTSTSTNTNTSMPTSSTTSTSTSTSTNTISGTISITDSKTDTNTNSTTTTISATDTNSNTSTNSNSNTTTASATGTSSNTQTSSPTSSSTTTGTTSPTDTGTNTGTQTSSDDGACSVSKGTAAKKVAPWLLAATFSLLFLASRRRRR